MVHHIRLQVIFHICTEINIQKQHCKHFRLIEVYRTCIDVTRKHFNLGNLWDSNFRPIFWDSYFKVARIQDSNFK